MNPWNSRFHVNFEQTDETHKFVMHHHPLNKFLYHYTFHYTYEMMKMCMCGSRKSFGPYNYNNTQ
jgi:hypothetical protein